MGRHKTELAYRKELIDAHHAAQEYPDNLTIQKKLKAIQDRWSKSIELIFYVDAREKIPYTTEEVGHECRTMPTHAICGHFSTGDYVCHLPEHNCITGVCWDRKGGEQPNPHTYHLDRSKRKMYLDNTNYLAADWYGTTMGTHDIKGDDNKVVKEDNLDRFFRECERAKTEGFDVMIVGVESTFEQFLSFRPNGNAGATSPSRAARSRSVRYHTGYFAHVEFYGSREAAIAGMIQENRWWCKSHYEKILNLEVT